MGAKELASGRRELISTDRLRKVDFLQGLTEGELQSIAHFFEEEDIGAGVTLCEEGARAEPLHSFNRESADRIETHFSIFVGATRYLR